MTSKDEGPKSRCSAFGAQKAVAVDRDILILDSKISNIQEAELAAAARHPFNNHAGTVFAVAFSPDSSFLATSGKDGIICIVEIETGAIRAQLKGHSNVVFSLQFSPDGKVLASGSRDGFVLLWDLTKTPVQRKAALKGHTSDVLSVAFSANGQLFASASFDQTILLWDMKRGANLKTLKIHTSSVNCCIFSPCSALLASASDDGTVCIYECAAATAPAHDFAYSNNSTTAVSPSVSGAGAGVASSPVAAGSPAAAMSPTHGSHHNSSPTAPATQQQLHQNTPGLKATLRGHVSEVNSFTFFPDGSCGASCGDDKKIILWEMATFQATRVLQSSAPVLSLAFSPDQYLLAGSNKDGSVCLFDLVHDYKMHRLVAAGHKEKAWSLSWSLDSTMLASCSGDAKAQVIIWDVVRGHRKQHLTGGHQAVITGAVFLDLPDAPFRIILETTDETGHKTVWDADSGRKVSVAQILDEERRKRDEMLRKSREDQVRRGIEVDNLKAESISVASKLENLEEMNKKLAAELEYERSLRKLEHDRHEAMLRQIYEHMGWFPDSWPPPVQPPEELLEAAAPAGAAQSGNGGGDK